MQPGAAPRPHGIGAPVLVVGVLNLLIGLWIAGTGAWMVVMLPVIAHSATETLAEADSLLRSVDPAYTAPSTEHMPGALKWIGITSLIGYTIGLLLVGASVAVLARRSWARTVSCVACVFGALTQLWSLLWAMIATSAIDSGTALMSQAMVSFLSFGFLAYFALAAAVLWPRPISLSGLIARTDPAPEFMEFPAARRS